MLRQNSNNSRNAEDRAGEILRQTRAIQAEVVQIRTALGADYIENLDAIAAEIEQHYQTISNLFEEAGAIKDANLPSTQLALKHAIELQLEIMKQLIEARKEFKAAKESLKDVEWDKKDSDKDDEDFIPALPKLRRVAPPDDFFFAHNLAEYEARRDLIQPLHNNIAATNEKIRRIVLQTKSLKVSATTAAARQKLTDQINTEIQLLKQYKGFLDDLTRRHNNIHSTHGQKRDDAFKNRPDISAETTHEDQVRLIAEKIALVNQHIATLNAAKARAAKDKAVNPQKSVFYSKLGDHQVFAETDPATNIRNATQAAYQFLGQRIQQQQAGAPDRLVGHVGIQQMSTEANHTCRFIGTEVTPKPGKPAIPVAFIQETNTEKSFSKQTMLLAPGHLKQLDKLPLFTRDKIAKIKEQMKFVANTIETSLAAITTNGPITVDNWPANLGKAAAVYCHYMGYDLHPTQLLSDIKPAELETLKRAFSAQIGEDADLKHVIDEAEARRDTKLLPVSHST